MPRVMRVCIVRLHTNDALRTQLAHVYDFKVLPEQPFFDHSFMFSLIFSCFIRFGTLFAQFACSVVAVFAPANWQGGVWNVRRCLLYEMNAHV
jgi:hypothetical protein